MDLAEVGAGGLGSIAWIDPAGALRVGPQSAGAEPGPACYALSGADPTLTDANVALGYLHPTHLLGGSLPIKAGPRPSRDHRPDCRAARRLPPRGLLRHLPAGGLPYEPRRACRDGRARAHAGRFHALCLWRQRPPLGRRPRAGVGHSAGGHPAVSGPIQLSGPALRGHDPARCPHGAVAALRGHVKRVDRPTLHNSKHAC